MKYTNVTEGEFVGRNNRFTAEVLIGGVQETVHVKNTGRMKELLFPGARVTLTCSDNPNRKTKYDLISAYKESLGWVNIRAGRRRGEEDRLAEVREGHRSGGADPRPSMPAPMMTG